MMRGPTNAADQHPPTRTNDGGAALCRARWPLGRRNLPLAPARFRQVRKYATRDAVCTWLSGRTERSFRHRQQPIDGALNETSNHYCPYAQHGRGANFQPAQAGHAADQVYIVEIVRM